MTATTTITPRGPRKRTARTFIQCGIGIAIGLPVAVANFDLPAATVSKVAGLSLGIAAVASLVMNEWDKANGNG